VWTRVYKVAIIKLVNKNNIFKPKYYQQIIKKPEDKTLGGIYE
jgi:hypothetical protein